MSESDTCGTCKFFFVNPGNSAQGECRLKPPQIFLIMRQTKVGGAVPGFLNSIPSVDSSFYCGEFKPKVVL